MTQQFYLSARRLRARGACNREVEKFKEVFGTGNIPFTKANWKKAVAAGLYVDWVARRVLGYERMDSIQRSVMNGHWFDLPTPKEKAMIHELQYNAILRRRRYAYKRDSK